MFYPSKITSIKDGDRVLEVGPGSDPFLRSDVLLEINLDEHQLAAQRGHTPHKDHGKEIVYYDGGRFPFKDGEFDYVIASHVLEHVVDPVFFVAELVRVGSAGYIEFPTVLYEYLYNFDVHLSVLNYRDNTVYYMKKSKLPFGAFHPIHDFYRQSIQSGYSQLVDSLQKDMFIGFEWKNRVKIQESQNLTNLVPAWSAPIYAQSSSRQTLQARIADKIRKALK